MSEGPTPSNRQPGESNEASMRVIDALAEATGRSATDIRPLGEVVDTDALNALMESGNGNGARPVRVSFVYEEFEISVEADDVTVRRRSSA